MAKDLLAVIMGGNGFARQSHDSAGVDPQ